VNKILVFRTFIFDAFN